MIDAFPFYLHKYHRTNLVLTNLISSIVNAIILIGNDIIEEENFLIEWKVSKQRVETRISFLHFQCFAIELPGPTHGWHNSLSTFFTQLEIFKVLLYLYQSLWLCYNNKVYIGFHRLLDFFYLRLIQFCYLSYRPDVNQKIVCVNCVSRMPVQVGQLAEHWQFKQVVLGSTSDLDIFSLSWKDDNIIIPFFGSLAADLIPVMLNARVQCDGLSWHTPPPALSSSEWRKFPHNGMLSYGNIHQYMFFNEKFYSLLYRQLDLPLVECISYCALS